MRLAAAKSGFRSCMCWSRGRFVGEMGLSPGKLASLFFFAGWVLTVRRLFLMLRVESDGQIDE